MSPGRPGARLSLKARALQWLAQREHSRSELRRKLLRQRSAGDDAEADRAVDAGTVDALLDWLEAHRYLSQERFVESRVHARAARYGNLRIRQELALHAVELTPAAEQGLKDSEYGRALAVWARRYGAPAANLAERARQARFLAARGFSAEIVQRVLRAHGSGAADDERDAPAH